MTEERTYDNGLTAFESPLLQDTPKIAHGFFTRAGGCSDGIYASLNCGFGSHDNAENVSENRRRVALALSGKAETPLMTPYQVHGDRAVIVDRDWALGDAEKADALVTDTPKLIIGILTADCTPVLFSDPQAGVIGAAHAGWKGAKKGILGATLTAMESLGAHRENITASIGPLLRQDSYEVTAEFVSAFKDSDSDNAAYFQSGRTNDAGVKHWQFNLNAYVVDQLKALGVGRIWALGADTYALSGDEITAVGQSDSPRCFSYRRTTHAGLTDYGRQISAIMMRGSE